MFPRHLITCVAALALMAAATGAADAGECLLCFWKVTSPAHYQAVTETVVVREGHTAWKRTPPTYKKVHERVMLSPGHAYTTTTPARYQFVAEKIVARPERVATRHIPAKYRTVGEKILVSPEKTVWVKRKGLLREIRVEAKYRIAHKKVEVEAGRDVSYRIPAVTATKRVKKLVKEATTVAHYAPPVYKTITKTVATPGTRTSYWVPAVTKLVHKTVRTAPATPSWLPAWACANCGGGYHRHRHHHRGPPSHGYGTRASPPGSTPASAPPASAPPLPRSWSAVG